MTVQKSEHTSQSSNRQLIDELNAILNIFISITNINLTVLALGKENWKIAILSIFIALFITIFLILLRNGPFNGGGGFPPASLLM